MNDHREVILNLIPLLSTMEEGIRHIQEQLSQLRYEEALSLFQDLMMGMLSIETAIKPMEPDLKDNQIKALGGQLKANMIEVVESYEAGKEQDLEKQVSDKVIPAFRNWKEEIEDVLRHETNM